MAAIARSSERVASEGCSEGGLRRRVQPHLRVTEVSVAKRTSPAVQMSAAAACHGKANGVRRGAVSVDWFSSEELAVQTSGAESSGIVRCRLQIGAGITGQPDRLAGAFAIDAQPGRWAESRRVTRRSWRCSWRLPLTSVSE